MPSDRPVMVGTYHAILVVSLDVVHLKELVQATLGILQRPVAVKFSRKVSLFSLEK